MIKKEDQEELKKGSNDAADLHTEGPLPEKDEVKQAEDRTAENQPHDISNTEKLKDEEGRPVSDTRKDE